MIILAGLGNPGPRYARNRHNVGFLAVDAVHARHRFAPWRQKFQAEIAEGTLGGERALLVKPLTYMNESGRAVGEAARFYKVAPGDIVAIHDELDLPPGKFRLKAGGGHGGHNGLRSLSEHLGEGYRRLRIGIGHPGAKELVHGYVLHDFAKADEAWLGPLLDAIAAAAPLLAEGQDATFANRVHLAAAPPKPKGDAPAKPAPAKPAPAKSAAGKPAAEDGDRPAAAPAKAAKAGGPFADALGKLWPRRDEG